MEFEIVDDAVTLRLTLAEATRLGVAIAAGYEVASRAEYFIRTGLSEPAMRLVAEALMNISDESRKSRRIKTIVVDAGVEEIENPRRPRPPQ